MRNSRLLLISIIRRLILTLIQLASRSLWTTLHMFQARSTQTLNSNLWCVMCGEQELDQLVLKPMQVAHAKWPKLMQERHTEMTIIVICLELILEPPSANNRKQSGNQRNRTLSKPQPWTRTCRRQVVLTWQALDQMTPAWLGPKRLIELIMLNIKALSTLMTS